MATELRIAPLTGERSVTERASELAARQFGAIARRQLVAIGWGPSRIESWLRMERLHRRFPGVYVWGRLDTGTEGDLAATLLYAGKGSALAGVSALWWRELLHRRPFPIHVDAPGRTSSRRGVAIRHPRRIEREWHRGLPVVPLPEALLAAAPYLRHDSLRLVVARAEFEGMLSLPSLQAALAGGRRGSRALRAAMDAHLPQLARCANDFERSFVLLCESFRLPIPEPNSRIGRYRPDMLWAEPRLIVELDGGDAHHTSAQRQADAARQAHLEALGYTVIRFTWAEVTYEPDRVAARVRAHLR